MVESQHRLEKQWNALHFGEVKVETRGGQHFFEVQVFLTGIHPQAVRVELCANGVKGGAFARQEMKLSPRPSDAPGPHLYSAASSADQPPADYTVRLVPHCEGVALPLEDARILWQR
jgi:starch phosphorylase